MRSGGAQNPTPSAIGSDCRRPNPDRDHEVEHKGARVARSNSHLSGRTPTTRSPPHTNAECGNVLAALFSIAARIAAASRHPQRLSPLFRLQLLAPRHVLIGSPASDPGDAPCAATGKSRREERPVDITSQPTHPLWTNNRTSGSACRSCATQHTSCARQRR